ncbi:MAG: PilZ domain-containing protein [bacterium]|nr:PilZ domain-containing protein [bacterium]
MSVSCNPITDFDHGRTAPRDGERRGARREGLRQVNYSPFPRSSLDAGKRMGLLLNESDDGLCLVVPENTAVGSLLRVTVQGLHGHTLRDVITRVVWCSEADEAGYRVGLELLRESQRQMLRVRLDDGRRVRSIHD